MVRLKPNPTQGMKSMSNIAPEYGYAFDTSYNGDASYGAEIPEAPAYYGADPAYYGAEGDAASPSFIAKAWSTVQGYAARVAGNIGWSLGAGAVVGGAYFFWGEGDMGEDLTIGDALMAGLITAGSVHVAACLVAGGLGALSSTSTYYGLGLIAAGAVAPKVTEWSREALGNIDLFGGNY